MVNEVTTKFWKSSRSESAGSGIFKWNFYHTRAIIFHNAWYALAGICLIVTVLRYQRLWRRFVVSDCSCILCNIKLNKSIHFSVPHARKIINCINSLSISLSTIMLSQSVSSHYICPPNDKQCTAANYYVIKFIFLNTNNKNKLCAWRHNMPPPPAS